MKNKIVELDEIEYVLLSDPKPTNKDTEWTAKGKTIDGYPVVLYWLVEESKINIEKPDYVEYV